MFRLLLIAFYMERGEGKKLIGGCSLMKTIILLGGSKVMKRVSKIILTMILMISSVLIFPVMASAKQEDASKYVNLNGNWNFKLYRTYDQMYQYFPYDKVNITWEDKEAALLPNSKTFSAWEKVTVPSDNAVTGGLMPLTKEDNSKFFPSWSEAWFCRTFGLSADFTNNDTVTLLLGIIDDNDVVYINGQKVAASGFVDGNGKKTLSISETGGFDYKNTDVTSRVKFEKSYWEVQREYSIPTSLLKIGGTNEISVRVFNNNGYGGFYAGKPMAICGNDLAVRAVKGLPSTPVDSSSLKEVVEKQIKSIETGDIDTFAKTIHVDYNNNGAKKNQRVAEVKAYIDNYTSIQITDNKAGYYKDSEENYWYAANRTMTGINKTTGIEETILAAKDIEVCYTLDDKTMYECGNKSRCYSVNYNSILFNKSLSYSVYLPVGYWDNTSKRYPVVYLLHGINSSSSSFVNVDRIEEHMDEWITNGTITDMIVVMPNSGKNAFYKDTVYDAKNADATGPWQTQITTELRKEIESNYRTINNAKFRGITGISMGGYGAMTIGTSFPGIFSSVASHMGALYVDALNSLKTLSKEQLEQYNFYIDCGLQDTMVDYKDTVNVHNYLYSMGIMHGFDLRDGGHNSAFYMGSMLNSMKMHSDHFLANGLLNAKLSKYTIAFSPDKKSIYNTDITITMQLNGNIFEGIKGLKQGTDYTLVDNQVVIQKDYLKTLKKDTQLEFLMASGKTLILTVDIK